MKVDFVNLGAQYEKIKPEIKEAIERVLDHKGFVLGKEVKAFEDNFAKFCGKNHCIGLTNGTIALYLALEAMGVKQGDEVITVPNSFIATAEAVSMIGAKPVFVDINPNSYLMDVDKIEAAITEKTKVILPVHLYGQPCDMDKIKEIADKHELLVLEDACQAHAAEYKGKRTPVLETGCFSFYPGKNLGAYGDAGAIVTDNDEIAEKARLLRDHGAHEKYHHEVKGYNFRMSGIQGAVLNVKLKYLEQWTEARRKNAQLYSELLGNSVVVPKEMADRKHAYHLFIIKAKNRGKLQEFLQQNEIYTGLHYPIPIHLQKAYSDHNFSEGMFPVTEANVKEILSLPMCPEISEEQIRFVSEKIKQFYNESSSN